MSVICIVISLPSDCFPAYVMQPLRRELFKTNLLDVPRGRFNVNSGPLHAA